MESQQRVSQSNKEFEAAKKVKDINDLISHDPLLNDQDDDDCDELSEEEEVNIADEPNKDRESSPEIREQWDQVDEMNAVDRELTEEMKSQKKGSTKASQKMIGP